VQKQHALEEIRVQGMERNWALYRSPAPRRVRKLEQRRRFKESTRRDRRDITKGHAPGALPEQREKGELAKIGEKSGTFGESLPGIAPSSGEGGT